MASPYPWHYTLRWPLYYNWPSTRNHANLQSAPDQHQFLDAKSDDIKLLFCGDIMVQPGDRIPELHPELSNLIQSVDLFIGNCESPLSSYHLNSHAKYRFIFNMPRKYLTGILNQTGLSSTQCLLSMANNHTGDQNYQGCLNTFDFLNDMGIIPLGRYDKEKPPVRVIEIKGLRLGFTAWTEWMNREIFPVQDPGVFRGEHIKRCDWKQLKYSVGIDYLFGIPHWEFEFQHFPCLGTRNMASTLINHSGIDFLVGSHPHVLQPIEWFSHGICAYSLGNFCGLGHAWPVKLLSLLEVKLRFDQQQVNLISYKMHYFFQKHEKNKVSIIPLTQAPPQTSEKLKYRIKRIFQNEAKTASTF